MSEETQEQTTNGNVATTRSSIPQDYSQPLTNIVTASELGSMPIGMRIMFDDRMLGRFYKMAEGLASSGILGNHLNGKVEACFAVVRMALNWNMDPFSVAQSTYSPGGGKIGIEGKLAVAAMLGSKKVKSIKYEHGGDWDKVRNKFSMQGGKPKATYTPDDEKGLYVVATALMYDGSEVSTPRVYLSSCHPRNSTQWDVRPDRQIMYVADRMLAQLAAGEIMMGVHFDVGLLRKFDENEVVDITPPKAVELQEEGIVGAGEVAPGTEQGVEFDQDTGEVKETNKRAKSEKVTVTWLGRDIGKTAFIRDLKHALKATTSMEQLRNLASKVGEAKQNASGEAPNMWETVEGLMSEAHHRISQADADEEDQEDEGEYDEGEDVVEYEDDDDEELQLT